MRDRKLSRGSTRAVGVVLSAAAALAVSMSPGLAAGDAAAGERDFRATCGACHSTDPGVNKIGPSLHGIVGMKSGAVPGYDFSPALKAANITWDATTLDKFIQNPGADVHGTKMVISVPNAQTRQDIIAYLETLKP